MIKLGSLFSGIGGFELGLERAIPGLQTVWQVEQNEFCQQVLKKHWKNSKIYDDVETVGKHNLEPVDIICGGFPCQDVSVLSNGEGLDGKKSRLWFEMYRIIRELRPKIAIIENSSALIIRGLSTIIEELASIGYACEWRIIRAYEFGLPHRRARCFVVAYPDKNRNRSQKQICSRWAINNKILYREKAYWEGRIIESRIRRGNNGIPNMVDRIKALGNSIVPQCSQYIGECILKSGLMEEI